MTDTETKLRTGLHAYGAETAAVASRPPIAAVALRAGAEPVRRRRWPKVAAGVVAGTVLTTGAAMATGILPAPVEATLQEFRSWGFNANQGAERMAVATDGEWTYEVWRAPLEGGGVCVYDRIIGPGVDDRGGSSCTGAVDDEHQVTRTPISFGAGTAYPEAIFDNSAGQDPESALMHSLGSGQLPLGATAAEFAFDDGTTLRVPAQLDGFFITTFPEVPDGRRITALRAVDAAGNIVVAI